MRPKSLAPTKLLFYGLLLFTVMPFYAAFQLPRTFYPKKQALSLSVSFTESEIRGKTSILLEKVHETDDDGITFNYLEETVSLEQVFNHIFIPVETK